MGLTSKIIHNFCG